MLAPRGYSFVKADNDAVHVSTWSYGVLTREPLSSFGPLFLARLPAGRDFGVLGSPSGGSGTKYCTVCLFSPPLANLTLSSFPRVPLCAFTYLKVVLAEEHRRQAA